MSNQRPKQAKLTFKHLENLYLSDYADSDDKDIDVLIGADFYFSFISGRCIRGTVPNSPVALESCIGWILTGPSDGGSIMSSQCVERLNVHSMMMVTTKNDLCEEFKEFWKVEAVPETSEESVIVELFHDIEFDG